MFYWYIPTVTSNFLEELLPQITSHCYKGAFRQRILKLPVTLPRLFEYHNAAAEQKNQHSFHKDASINTDIFEQVELNANSITKDITTRVTNNTSAKINGLNRLLYQIVNRTVSNLLPLNPISRQVQATFQWFLL